MNIGSTRHVVTVQQPSPPTPDGHGGYLQTFSDATPPTWPCAIQTATAQELERLGAGTAIGWASHVLKGRYRADLTAQSRVIFEGRIFTLTSVIDLDERHTEVAVIGQELRP